MIPRFRFMEGGIYVGTQVVSLRCRCDCGKSATVLASFRILRLPSGDNIGDDNRRSEEGALLLCYDCAMEMWRQEIEHKLRCSWMEETDYMLVEHALEVAKSQIPSHDNKKTGKIGKRWQEILMWMTEQEQPVAVRDVCRKFGLRTSAVATRLHDLHNAGILSAEKIRKRMHYRINKKPSG